MKKTKVKDTFKVEHDPEASTIVRDDDPEGQTFGEAKRELIKYYQDKIKQQREHIKRVKALTKEDCY